MLSLIISFIGYFIFSYTVFYVSKKVSNSNEKVSKKILFVLILFYLICSYIVYGITDSFVKVLVNFVILVIFIRLTFNFNFIKSFIYGFFVYVLSFFAEFIAIAILTFLFQINISDMSQLLFNSFITNTLISVILIILVNIRNFNKIIKKLFNEIYIKKNRFLIILLSFVILMFGMLAYSMYFEINYKSILIINFSLLLLYTVLTISTLNQANQNAKLKEDYTTIVNEMNDYELVLKKLRKKNHDNNNNLIVIKGLCRSKIAREYIDSILNNQEEKDDDLLLKVKDIPYGGLQGLVYKKLSIMKNKKINYLIHSSNLDKIGKLSIEINRDICTIVGILLDNAIEATEKIKNKDISIIFSKDREYLVIEVSNTYEGTIEFDKIENEGFSTKGDNRGFGLNLVKEIVDKNPNIENEKRIVGNFFTQVIKIKI